MYKALLSLVIALLFSNSAWAQSARYEIVSSEVESTNIVILQIKTYCQDKDAVDAEAQCAAIRATIFDGIPNTKFHKPLLTDGEKTMINKYPSYFNGLYADRYTDFIANYKMLSKFKKADKNKSTLYEIKVKVFPLRKDLEQNNIKKQFGL